MIQKESKLKPLFNPFASARVDNPFQEHLDLPSLYENEYKVLFNNINNIKLDPNRQSKGSVLIAKPGSGKTHLIMRLAKHNLTSNRLFFIRQPNNKDNILHHIYSRILESFFEHIPGTTFSQLEYLLAKTFTTIVLDYLNKKESYTHKDNEIIELLKEDPLNLFSKLGAEGSEKKIKNWLFIEKKMLLAWREEFGFGGYSATILRGLIKYCRYSDENKREIIRRWLSGEEIDEELSKKIGLSNWNNTLQQESFSLEAINTFAKLSLKDEPLIIVFDQLEGLKHKPEVASNFTDALKEIFTHMPNTLIISIFFEDRWKWFKQSFDGSIIERMGQQELYLKSPTPDELRKILEIRLDSINLTLEETFSKENIDELCKSSTIRSVILKASVLFDKNIFGIDSGQSIKTFEEKMEDDIKSIKKDLQRILLLIGSKNISLEKMPFNLEEYLNTTYQTIFNNYQNNLFSQGDDLGKVIKTVEFFERVLERDYKRSFLKSEKPIPDNIVLDLNGKKHCIAFLHKSGNSFDSHIRNFNEVILENSGITFTIIRDQRSDQLIDSYKKQTIVKLIEMLDGEYIELRKGTRCNFDMIDRIVEDINNEDIEITDVQGLGILKSRFKDNWLIKILKLKEDIKI